MATRFTGKLRTWNAERGFGFIAPSNGSAELFVHISAFPRDGTQPVQGETVSYELGRGKDGRPQAVAVIRAALGNDRPVPRAARPVSTRRRSRLGPTLVALVMLGVLGAYGYQQYRSASRGGQETPALASPSSRPAADPVAPRSESFTCDGRTHCGEMRSCEEAKFFLRNCPGTQMDGDGDGVPCESQWCS